MSAPRVIRSAPLATSTGTPMAVSTWLARFTPALQAEPVDASTPAASKSMISESPSAPGKLMCRCPGSAPTSGVQIRTPSMLCAAARSLSRATRILAVACSSSLIDDASAAAHPTAPCTFTVPERSFRSWPPPRTGLKMSASRRASSRPVFFGPPNLWALAASVVAPRVWKSTGMWPTACTASVWKGTPLSRAKLARLSNGWIAPVSLLAHMQVSSARSLGAPALSSRPAIQSSARMRPTASTGRTTRSKPRSSGPAVSQSTDSTTAGCSMSELAITCAPR